ncbi:MAG: class I SAM-dependent methyltransferase [Caldisericales bacterium]|nr:class I SAM-dependent methyltransferase [Caldisericales bacterium]
MASFPVKLLLVINRLFPKGQTHPLDLERKNKGSYATWEYDLAKRTIEYFPTSLSIKKLIKGKDILDDCCGAGGKAVYLRDLGAKSVTGVDIGPEFIAMANDFAAARGATNCNFVPGDAMSLPFPDKSFDLVFAFDAFEHVKDPALMLKEARRVLRPGGKAIMSFTTWGRPGGHHLTDAIRFPFAHLFFSEKTLLGAYRTLVDDERYVFRAGSLDSKKIEYVNHMSFKKGKRIVYDSGFKVLLYKGVPYPGIFRFLAKMGLGEYFYRVVTTILEEPDGQEKQRNP